MPLKLKKQPATGPRHVLQHEVAVEQHGLHFGQHVVVAVQITPARLHHADLRIGEEMHRAPQEIRRAA